MPSQDDGSGDQVFHEGVEVLDKAIDGDGACRGLALQETPQIWRDHPKARLEFIYLLRPGPATQREIVEEEDGQALAFIRIGDLDSVHCGSHATSFSNPSGSCISRKPC